jgi:DNA-binding helix-turn-helix protein
MEPVINSKKLRGRIHEEFRSLSEFTRTVGWSQNKIGNILSGRRVPDINECAQMAEALNLDTTEYVEIFLPQLSPNGDKKAS